MKEVIKSVYVYGGAFNPPTVAHEKIVKQCYDLAQAHGADLWIMPSGDRPDKTIAVDPSRRLAYIDAMLQSLNITARVETYELFGVALTETIDTVEYLQHLYPDVEFTWVFGADSIATMFEWKGGETIWHREKMLLTSRPGYEIHTIPPRAEVIDVATPNVSSTMVREKIARGESLDGLVSACVADIISVAEGVKS